MAKGLKEGEPNGRDVYPDIIDHPHWESPKRPRMSLTDRAAQFSSFDALAGYSDMVAEEQRLTDREIELDDASLERLNRKLELIADAIAAGQQPILTFTVFVPDQSKSGGTYKEITDRVKRIDVAGRRIVLTRTQGYGKTNQTIDFQRIIGIRGELTDWMEE